MISKTVIMLSFVLGGFYLVNCKQTQPLRTSNNNEVKPMWIETGQKYYLEIREPDLSSFKAKVNKVKIGDSKEQIINLLGRPYYEGGASKKESDKIMYYLMDYYVKKVEEKRFSEDEDKLVTIYFSTDWKVREVSTNIEGVNNVPRVFK